MVNIYQFYIESNKYPNGIQISEPALSKEIAESRVKQDFNDINDNITHFEFIGIKE